MSDRHRRYPSVRTALLAIGVTIAVATSARTPDLTASDNALRARTAPDTTLLQRMLDVEDARATDSASLAALHEGLRSADAEIRQRAARAFGRLERSGGTGPLSSALNDPVPAVRAEAVNAMAQIASGEAQRARAAGDSSEGPRVVVSVAGALVAAAGSETDQLVRDVIVRSLSRLPYRSPAAAASAVSSLLDARASGGTGISNFARVYALDNLVRRTPALRTEPAVITAVASLDPSSRNAQAWPREARVLRASVRGRLLAAAPPESPSRPNAWREIRRAFVADFGDSEPQVRRQVIAFVAGASALDDTARARLVDAALRDSSPHVRVEAVRAYARRANASCGALLTATRDGNAHVALTAIDVIPTVGACRDASAPVDRLVQLTRSIPGPAASRRGTQASWHAGAHAVVSLARMAPQGSRPIIASLAAHQIWQVRMYAATAAGVIGDTGILGRLAADTSDNVRDAAVNALFALVRTTASSNTPPRFTRTRWFDSIFVSQLTRRDYQLVLDAARALEGAPDDPGTAGALVAALDRITEERSETSRDPRMELLARVQSIGNGSQAARLTRYLSDFDSVVGERATAVLRAWATAAVASANRLAPLPVSLRDVAQLRGARVRVTMAPSSGGGSFDLELFPDDAPATIARFVSLARRGYYNGLTFHRVATNFVIQGGSPGANEYVGADRYMRDELGLRSHTRGTLGISTRGRDTGDAQIFVNLIDNFRLDHDYTVFAEVVRGMDVVDRVLEGDVIARVAVMPSPPRSR